MKYKLVVANSISSIEEIVSNLLNLGWEIEGGICIVLVGKTETTIKFNYYQAVTKK